MPFIETEASVRYEFVNGQRVPVITPKTEVTLTNAAGTAFVIDNNISLSANEKEQVLSEPLIMLENEILKVQATSGNVDVIASILEINREDR